METIQLIKKAIPYLRPELIEAMANETIVSLEKDTEILRQGQYVKVIPVVLEGVAKVFSRIEDKELLLYYIQPNESCIMSFASSLKNHPSPVFASIEETSKVLLLPVAKVHQWLKDFPEINTLFYQQYNLRYSDLLDTINHLVFDKLDVRVYDYLKQRATILKTNELHISHRKIAAELGTAREVVSRIVKKLEQDNKLLQRKNCIEIL